MKRLTMSLCLLAPLALGAPRPAARPAREAVLPRPEAGRWALRWDGGDYLIILRKDGSYACSGGWEGYWTWEPKTRLFSVSESANEGNSWLNWSATLDRDLSGSGRIKGGGAINVSMARQSDKGPKI